MIDNIYERQILIPAPQTGVDRNKSIPVLMLSFGTVCIAGAEIYRKKTKNRG